MSYGEARVVSLLFWSSWFRGPTRHLPFILVVGEAGKTERERGTDRDRTSSYPATLFRPNTCSNRFHPRHVVALAW